MAMESLHSDSNPNKTTSSTEVHLGFGKEKLIFHFWAVTLIGILRIPSVLTNRKFNVSEYLWPGPIKLFYLLIFFFFETGSGLM